jgi:pimeloyl-ACP methyl ester carboxylesterase
MVRKTQSVNEGIIPIRVNRLRGHMLRKKSNRAPRKEILLLYDQNMDLTTTYRFAKKLSYYGNVTVPYLPGFEGMDSFYKIKLVPSVSNYAAYLASFVALRYKNKRFTIVGLGIGGTIAARMLQNHAKATAKVNQIILLGSTVDRNDIARSGIINFLALAGYNVLLLRPIVFLSKILVCGSIRGFVIGLTKNSSPQPGKLAAEQEGLPRQSYDLRTHFYLQKQLRSLRVQTGQVDIPAYALAINTPPKFSYGTWQQHLHVMFKNVTTKKLGKKPVPTDTIFETLPAEVKKLLRN